MPLLRRHLFARRCAASRRSLFCFSRFVPFLLAITPAAPPGTHHGPTLWAGTNSGSVYAYALEVPGVGSGRASERGGAGDGSACVEAVLGKEIQLMHRAPVVSICVLDGRGKPLPDPYEASQDLAIAPDMTNAHSVLIASEEQLKVRRTSCDDGLSHNLGIEKFINWQGLPVGVLSSQSERQD